MGSEIAHEPCITCITSDVFAHWQPFPHALAAIHAFSQRYEPARNADELCALVRKSWTDNDGLCGIYIIHPAPEAFLPVMGHALLTVEGDLVGHYVHFWQAEIDHDYASRISYKWMDHADELAAKWAVARGIHRLSFATSRNPKYFMRRYGYRVVRTFLEKEV